MGTLAAKLCSRPSPKGSPASSTTPALLDAAFACLGVDQDQDQNQTGGGGGGGGLSDLFAKPGLPPSGRGEILLLLLNALRNASFVPSNERCIGHSARAVQVGGGGRRDRARSFCGGRGRVFGRLECAFVCVCSRLFFYFGKGCRRECFLEGCRPCPEVRLS